MKKWSFFNNRLLKLPEAVAVMHKFEKVMKNDEMRFENASSNFLFTYKEAVEKPLSVFQQPAKGMLKILSFRDNPI